MMQLEAVSLVLRETYYVAKDGLLTLPMECGCHLIDHVTFMSKIFDERLSLHAQLVKQEFSFLENDFEFHQVPLPQNRMECTGSKFQSSNVFLEMIYGPPGFELDFRIGRNEIEGLGVHPSFSAGELLNLHDDVKNDTYRILMANSLENLKSGVPKLAAYLAKYGRDCLLGSDEAFEKLLAARKNTLNSDFEKQKHQKIRALAEEAWKNKNFPDFIKKINCLGKHSTELEKKRLEYAKSKL
jgi:hypothetical protein